jgi:hypothetical protein
MNRNYGNVYIGQRIRIDGNIYEECIFEECILEFGGTAEVGFINCSIVNSHWSFVGCASTTLNFMHAMYHGFGPDGQRLIEDTFAQIRRAPMLPNQEEHEQSELTKRTA